MTPGVKVRVAVDKYSVDCYGCKRQIANVTQSVKCCLAPGLDESEQCCEALPRA